MPSRVSDVVFSEPSGRPHALVMFSGALVFSGLYAYYGIFGDARSVSWLAFLIAGFVLSGVAESLPEDRRLATGAMRLTAVLVLMCLLAATVFAPELVVGPR